MKKDWKQFYLPMVALLGSLFTITCFSYWRYGPNFWQTFVAHFLATVFGVTFTVMFTFVIWRYQQRVHQSHQREQLIRDLKFEVDENIKRLEDTDKFFDDSKRKGGDSATWRGLRTVTSKHILKPENLVIIKDIQLEDDIEWMLMHIEKYNTVFADASRQFFNNLQYNKDIKETKSQMRSHLLSESHFQFLQGFLKDLSRRIARLS